MRFAGWGLSGGAVASKCDTVSYVAPRLSKTVCTGGWDS